MAAAGGLVAPDERLRRRFEEQYAHVVELLAERLDLGDRIARAADDEGDAVEPRIGRVGELADLGHEVGREVVDHEPTEVFERVASDGTSGS